MNPAFVVTTYIKTYGAPLLMNILYVTTDRYAIAILKDDVIIGHLPRVMSRMCSLFIARGGVITCIVTGARRYSVDLPH